MVEKCAFVGHFACFLPSFLSSSHNYQTVLLVRIHTIENVDLKSPFRDSVPHTTNRLILSVLVMNTAFSIAEYASLVVPWVSVLRQ